MIPRIKRLSGFDPAPSMLWWPGIIVGTYLLCSSLHWNLAIAIGISLVGFILVSVQNRLRILREQTKSQVLRQDHEEKLLDHRAIMTFVVNQMSLGLRVRRGEMEPSIAIPILRQDVDKMRLRLRPDSVNYPLMLELVHMFEDSPHGL